MDHLEKRKKGLEEEIYSIEEAQGHLNKIEDLGNEHLDRFREELRDKLEVAKRRLNYVQQELEGPWMDKMGRINKGDYDGFYIVPLLQAMAASAKDFPTAMKKIAEAANDQKLLEQDHTMYPKDYSLTDEKAYGYLYEMAPEANWKQVDQIFWDT